MKSALKWAVVPATLLAIAVGLLVQGPPSALAATQVTITLMSGNGVVGGPDANVQFLDSTNNWVPAFVIAAHPSYATIAGTQWVNSGPTFDTATPNPTRFRTMFNLPAGFSAPSISVDFHADNFADVFLNGTLIGGQPHVTNVAHFQNPPENASTANPLLFQTGANTLEFELTNTGGPKGLDFLATVLFTARGPDLTVTKDLKPGQPRPRAGGKLFYLVRVKNEGNVATPAPPKTVTLVDTPPTGTTIAAWSIISGSGTCSINGAGQLVCSLGANMAPGAETIVEVVINTPKSGTLTNTATVDPHNQINETDETNNTDQEVTVIP